MTQEYISINNPKFAVFMGAIYSEYAKAWGFGNAIINPNEVKIQGRIYKNAVWAEKFETELKYHSSWEWLMPVIEKIELLTIELPEIYKKGFKKNSTTGQILIHCEYDNREEFIGWYSSASIELEHPFIYDSLNTEPKRFQTKFEGLYVAVVKFIDWCNENIKCNEQ